MSKLQQLLDEKWPVPAGLPANAYTHTTALREAFTEGYNAGMEKVKEIAGLAMSKGWHLGWDDRDKNQHTYDTYGDVHEFVKWFDKITNNG